MGYRGVDPVLHSTHHAREGVDPDDQVRVGQLFRQAQSEAIE